MVKQFTEWFSRHWGDLASMISLVLTGVIAWRVRSLENRLEERYTLIGRLPQINQNLIGHCSIINSCLLNFRDRHEEAVLELNKAAVTLEALQESLPRRYKLSKVEEALRLIKDYRVGVNGSNGMRDIHTVLSVVVDKVAYMREGTIWKSQ